MQKVIVVDVPEGARQVLVTVYDPDDTRPHGWEEIAVRENPDRIWTPIELTDGNFRVEDERGSVVRSW